MNDSEELAPAVASILRSAEARGDPEGGPLSVDARSLPAALSRAETDGRVPVIAEVKPTSPTTDGTRDADPVELAERMVDGGAAALSVLTEPDHFGGSPENLRRIRETVDVPVLRKDFVVRESQLDTVAADVVLLIARFVGSAERSSADHSSGPRGGVTASEETAEPSPCPREDDDLADLVAAAEARGFQPLVEVHDAAELERAVAAGAELIGVNNRDLAKLEVDLETFETVAPQAPGDVTLVAESGIGSPGDARRMVEAGADGLLVGSAIMDGVSESSSEDRETESLETVTENTRRLTRARTQR
ncbi:indole-3-glycerol-phosphate synthase [Halorussus sp. MSC15.2]|uniref:indole-3-glycerol-phosphate synthase n=1 Tax=Halorussus sp. MSC15.2 TaxID=2283638 RepID=UPI0013D727FE|nr:indole-3-glycerol-phosphate synthase [Halorussus sp. MSC15.2]NEU57514.1 indole-3-glycerol-phosphate synthase [Halorussus sp. MSC15.2]